METSNTKGIFSEYTKVIGQIKLPGIDPAALVESSRKDIEALAEANTTVLGGMQALVQKQADILQSTLTELQSFVTNLTAAGKSPANAGELVQQTLHKAMTDMRELADTAYRAQSDSFAVVAKRVAGHVEELKSSLQPKK